MSSVIELIHKKAATECELRREEQLMLELEGGSELTSKDVAHLLMFFADSLCVAWMPKSLFGGIHVTSAAARMGLE